ncbi:hypothetical protein NDU88_002850 [Pleurodeles waltl]|uniref:Uncharacterized protein n=1 Tax=Pleurodeles waltl TaxID=8319 RepID=A0AAV7MQU5_PLEWA|nr:hypothetical protein NDU88_002850 [Pleurodeles waltl]
MEGDRAGHMLARLIKQEKYSQPILAVRDRLGQEVYAWQAINEVFVEHLRGVYTLPSGASGPTIMTYFEALPLPRLDGDEHGDPAIPLTKQEVLLAIDSLKTDKALGEVDFQ